jgi:argininosuccinate synthase
MGSRKVILAYSGGLDTSVCIRYLQKMHRLDVVTLTVDCGQDDDFVEIEQKAKSIGAIKHIYIDAKEEFASNYILPCIRANGLYEGKYPLATALTRPLIAAKAVQTANEENASFISHGCTGKGNDQIRFDVTIRSLNSQIKIISPIRDMNLTRDSELSFAREEGIPISTEAKKYSIDANLWGRAIEGGMLEDTYSEPPEEIFHYVKSNDEKPGYIELEFKKGIPTSVDGEEMNLISIINSLNEKIGSSGVGIIDQIEDRVVGVKSREVYEAPAAVAIIESHKDLEKMVLTSHELRFKQLVDEQWSWLVYCGLWQEPLRTDLEKFIESTQRKVNGKVRLRTHKGSIRVVGRESKYSIYDNSLATYITESTFDQSLAKGFTELWGMQSIVANSIFVDTNSSTNKEKNNK